MGIIASSDVRYDDEATYGEVVPGLRNERDRQAAIEIAKKPSNQSTLYIIMYALDGPPEERSVRFAMHTASLGTLPDTVRDGVETLVRFVDRELTLLRTLHPDQCFLVAFKAVNVPTSPTIQAAIVGLTLNRPGLLAVPQEYFYYITFTNSLPNSDSPLWAFIESKFPAGRTQYGKMETVPPRRHFGAPTEREAQIDNIEGMIPGAEFEAQTLDSSVESHALMVKMAGAHGDEKTLQRLEAVLARGREQLAIANDHVAKLRERVTELRAAKDADVPIPAFIELLVMERDPSPSRPCAYHFFTHFGPTGVAGSPRMQLIDLVAKRMKTGRAADVTFLAFIHTRHDVCTEDVLIRDSDVEPMVDDLKQLYGAVVVVPASGSRKCTADTLALYPSTTKLQVAEYLKSLSKGGAEDDNDNDNDNDDDDDGDDPEPRSTLCSVQ